MYPTMFGGPAPGDKEKDKLKEVLGWVDGFFKVILFPIIIILIIYICFAFFFKPRFSPCPQICNSSFHVRFFFIISPLFMVLISG